MYTHVFSFTHVYLHVVVQVMTKIALLEDERLRLLETIDQMQTDNQSVSCVCVCVCVYVVWYTHSLYT